MAASKSLPEADLLKLLQGGVYNARIASLVRHCGSMPCGKDAYDKNMQLWKTALLAQPIVKSRRWGQFPEHLHRQPGISKIII